MIYPARYACLGELLYDALIQYKTEIAHIEWRRKKEVSRLTYLQFKHEVGGLVRGFQQRGIESGDHVAILLPNQGRWLQAATAIFLCGGVLVPLDYKLTAPEQQDLLAHSGAKALVIEAGLFRRGTDWSTPLIVVTDSETPLGGTVAWDDLSVDGPPIVPVHRQRKDVATLVYSSGTGGTPKGCLLPHRAYLEQYQGLLALYPMSPGDRYFSILPTNHAIDFMIGFVAPFACGATVVHQRTLRPEFITHTMKHCGITHMAVVPMILESLERGLRDKLDALPEWQQSVVEGLSGLNTLLTRKRPQQRLSRHLLKPIHDAFGGKLKMLFCGGAFVDAERAAFFYRLGIPVVIGYGLTEACTVITAQDLKPFRADSVGRPVDGVDVRVVNTNNSGVGDVQVRGPTLMLGYYNEPELTKAAFDGDWLITGDLGRLDASGHLHLVGRSKNMIVTSGGKNIYPEDIEQAFEPVPSEELVVFAKNYLWPEQSLVNEELLVVIRPKEGETAWLDTLKQKNHRLPDFKRISGVLVWDTPFPRTASMKVKRELLADALRARVTRDRVLPLG